MLIGLLCLLALLHGVFRGRLGPNRLDVCGFISMSSMELLGVVRLHLEHQVTVLDVRLCGTECGAVSVERGVVRLVPPVGIKGVEVISPVEIEAHSLCIVSIGLNIVILDIPWHVLGIESLAPGFESGSPEVHHDGLWLGCQLHRGVVLGDAAHLLVIDRICDEIRRPCHLVDVPFALGVEACAIIVRLTLGMAVSVDHVH